LIVALEGTLRLLHPFMPFISEELWSCLPAERETLLATADWPVVNEGLVDVESERRFELVKSLVSAIRTIRAEYGIKPGKEIGASVETASDTTRQAFDAELGTIKRLGKIDNLSFESPDDAVGAHAVLPDGTAVFVPLGDAIDIGAECDRLGGEMERLDKQIRAVTAKLANENFTTRAPADVVERERQKEQAWREQHDTLAAKRRSLGC
jgi:valyl-tRNA synthetase